MKVDYSHNSELVGTMLTGRTGPAKQASRINASNRSHLIVRECQKILFCAFGLISERPKNILRWIELELSICSLLTVL